MFKKKKEEEPEALKELDKEKKEEELDIDEENILFLIYKKEGGIIARPLTEELLELHGLCSFLQSYTQNLRYNLDTAFAKEKEEKK